MLIDLLYALLKKQIISFYRKRSYITYFRGSCHIFSWFMSHVFVGRVANPSNLYVAMATSTLRYALQLCVGHRCSPNHLLHIVCLSSNLDLPDAYCSYLVVRCTGLWWILPLSYNKAAVRFLQCLLQGYGNLLPCKWASLFVYGYPLASTEFRAVWWIFILCYHLQPWSLGWLTESQCLHGCKPLQIWSKTIIPIVFISQALLLLWTKCVFWILLLNFVTDGSLLIN